LTRVAVVTGAARGIGAATVRHLAADGWMVVAVDRACDDPRLPYRMGSAAELHAVVEAAGTDRVTAAAADATDVDALRLVVQAAEGRLGGVDAIVAVAGVVAGGVPVWEMPADQQDAVLEVNLGGALAAARAGIPALLRRPEPREGRFIVVASSAASRGLPLLAAYCAAKAGLVGLVRALGLELRGTGITANAVSPGSTRTKILEESARLYGLGSGEQFASQQPIERLLEPDEVAALIVWLASAAGSAVTGADLPIDGGLSL
jgi:SDR family mycofactocin-dependent oxidoreductase